MPTRCSCAARQAIAAVEQPVGELEPRERLARAGGVGRIAAASASAFQADQAPSRPASTAVTTRSRGGIGGLWCTMPMRARSARSARRAQLPRVARRARRRGRSVGRSAAPSTRSSVVLPAPDGPITATRSPAASASDTPSQRAVAVRVNAGRRRRATGSSAASRRCAAHLSRPGRLRRGLDAVVVRALRRDELRRPLQVQDLLRRRAWPGRASGRRR